MDKWGWDSALLIGYITLLGYLGAYEFNKAYYDFYKMPDIYRDKIGLDILMDTISALIAIIATFFMLHALFIGPILTKEIHDPVKRAIRKCLFISVLFGAYIFYTNDIIVAIIIGIILILVWLWNLVLPLVFYPKTKGYKFKLSKFQFSEKRPFQILKYDIKTKNPQLYIWLIGGFILVRSFSGIIGTGNATLQDNFTTTVYQEQKYVVFKANGDNLLVAPLKDNSKLVPEYREIEKKNLIFKYEQLNSIKIVEERHDKKR